MRASNQTSVSTPVKIFPRRAECIRVYCRQIALYANAIRATQFQTHSLSTKQTTRSFTEAEPPPSSRRVQSPRNRLAPSILLVPFTRSETHP